MAYETVNASDVAITDLTVEAVRTQNRVQLRIKVRVHNENDDDAPRVRCIVVLPPTAHITSTGAEGPQPGPLAHMVNGPVFPPVGPANGFLQSEPVHGYVLFALLRSLPVRQSASLMVQATVHESYATRPISAFAFSDGPDPDPSNNFMWAAATF